MSDQKYIDLGVDFGAIQSYADYKRVWRSLCPVQATMVEKHEECQHKLGDTFHYENHYDKPQGICSALHHVFQLYLWRASLGFPSWENDPAVYRIHCPDKKGTVWELKRASIPVYKNGREQLNTAKNQGGTCVQD